MTTPETAPYGSILTTAGEIRRRGLDWQSATGKRLPVGDLPDGIDDDYPTAAWPRPARFLPGDVVALADAEPGDPYLTVLGTSGNAVSLATDLGIVTVQDVTLTLIRQVEPTVTLPVRHAAALADPVANAQPGTPRAAAYDAYLTELTTPRRAKP